MHAQCISAYRVHAKGGARDGSGTCSPQNGPLEHGLIRARVAHRAHGELEKLLRLFSGIAISLDKILETWR